MANEKKIFTKHYASLCDTITDVDHLLPHFVAENIINTNDVKVIDAMNTPLSKVKELLSHISGPLKAGDAKGLHTMLTIMKKHGNQSTIDLADKMSHEVASTINKTEDEGKCTSYILVNVATIVIAYISM